jgi:hypothetical protein
VPESRLEQTEHGLAQRGPGWFVLDGREALVLAVGAPTASTTPATGART